MVTMHAIAKGDGPTVAFLHGLGESHAFWLGIASRLKGYRCLLVDLPGHGQSPASASREAAVEELVQLLREERAEALVGHSLGAALGSLAAPDLALKAMVLVGWGGHASPQLREKLAQGDLAGAYRLLYSASYLAKRPGFVEQITKGTVRRPLESLTGWAELLPPSVEIPTLLVAGEEDQVVPVADVRDLRERYPKGRLLVMKGVGHVPPIEMPKAFSEILVHFLSTYVRPNV